MKELRKEILKKGLLALHREHQKSLMGITSNKDGS